MHDGRGRNGPIRNMHIMTLASYETPLSYFLLARPKCHVSLCGLCVRVLPRKTRRTARIKQTTKVNLLLILPVSARRANRPRGARDVRRERPKMFRQPRVWLTTHLSFLHALTETNNNKNPLVEMCARCTSTQVAGGAFSREFESRILVLFLICGRAHWRTMSGWIMCS